MRRAVFLDRDGVLNTVTVRDGVPRPPAGVDELEIFPDVSESLDRLKGAGFALVVVTNQPDVARLDQKKEVVEAINAELMSRLPLDEIRVCYHDDADACSCRKPKPGLLVAPPRYDLKGSFMIGDRWRDIEAGSSAGCRTILVRRTHEERESKPDHCAATLNEAADWILTQSD